MLWFFVWVMIWMLLFVSVGVFVGVGIVVVVFGARFGELCVFGVVIFVVGVLVILYDWVGDLLDVVFVLFGW